MTLRDTVAEYLNPLTMGGRPKEGERFAMLCRGLDDVVKSNRRLIAIYVAIALVVLFTSIVLAFLKGEIFSSTSVISALVIAPVRRMIRDKTSSEVLLQLIKYLGPSEREEAIRVFYESYFPKRSQASGPNQQGSTTPNSGPDTAGRPQQG